MKRILGAVALVTLLAGPALAAPASAAENSAKVTLIYDHEIPNVPGKSLRAVLVEYAPGGFSDAHTHAKSAFITATVLSLSSRPTRPGRASPSCRATAMPSARTAARPNRPGCWPSSSSTPARPS
jgi:hypothetical protein